MSESVLEERELELEELDPPPNEPTDREELEADSFEEPEYARCLTLPRDFDGEGVSVVRLSWSRERSRDALERALLAACVETPLMPRLTALAIVTFRRT
ncbi:hypothetical protein [Natronococcus jeotgali]|nr:hypothetical protein [Natronococcus jeotgali]